MAGRTPWRDVRADAITTPEDEQAVERERGRLDLARRLYDARRAVGKSQVEVAEALGVSQANVSRIERSPDVRVSTLDSYVHALGGRLEVRAVFDDGEEIVLTGAQDTPGE